MDGGGDLDDETSEAPVSRAGRGCTGPEVPSGGHRSPGAQDSDTTTPGLDTPFFLTVK